MFTVDGEPVHEIFQRTQQLRLRLPTERQPRRHVETVVENADEMPRPIDARTSDQLQHESGAVRRPVTVENAERSGRGCNCLVVPGVDDPVGSPLTSLMQRQVGKPPRYLVEQRISEQLGRERQQVGAHRFYRRRRGMAKSADLLALVVVVGQLPHPVDDVPRNAVLVFRATRKWKTMTYVSHEDLEQE